MTALANIFFVINGYFVLIQRCSESSGMSIWLRASFCECVCVIAYVCVPLRTRAFTKPLLFIVAIRLRMTYLRRKISLSHVRPNLETERRAFHTMHIKHTRKMQLCLRFWLNFHFSAWKKQYLEDNKKHSNLKTYILSLGILKATSIRFFFHYCIFLANFIFFATYFTYYPIYENGNTERK